MMLFPYEVVAGGVSSTSLDDSEDLLLFFCLPSVKEYHTGDTKSPAMMDPIKPYRGRGAPPHRFPKKKSSITSKHNNKMKADTNE